MTELGAVPRSALFVVGQALDRLCYAVLLAFITYVFGVSGETDLYFIVTVVPLMIVALNNETMLVVAMQFLSTIRDEANHWAAVGRIMAFFIPVFLVMSMAAALLAPIIVSVVGFGLDGDARARAVELERIAAWFILAHGVSTAIGAVLMHEGEYAWAVFRPALSSALAMVIALAFLLTGTVGISVFLYGMLIAPMMVASLLLWPLFRVKGENRIFAGGPWRMADGLFLFGSALYNALGNANYQVLVLVERTVASSFGAGFVTVLSLARTMLSLLAFIPSGVANALFVDLARQSWERRRGDIARIGARIGRAGLFIALPALIIYFAGSDALVGILFERGKFGADSTGTVAKYAVLLGLAGPYMAMSTPVAKIMQLAHLNRELAIGSNCACAIYVVAAIVAPLYWGPEGLALCAALHGIVYLVTIYGILVRRFGWSILSIDLPKQLAAAIVSVAFVVALRSSPLWPKDHVLCLASICIVALLPYATMSYLLDLNDARVWSRAQFEKIRTRRLLPFRRN